MKFITPKLHGIIDYVVVLFLLAAPTIFGISGNLAMYTYALGIVHLVLTLLTDFAAGVIKVIPLPIHGIIEFVVGIALIILAYTVLKDDALGKMFYAVFGIAVLLVFLFSDYRKAGTA